MHATKKLIEYGQSIWYDNISREILQNGELKRLIAEYGIRGLTSNPTIFDNAISKSSVYDEMIRPHAGKPIDAIYEALAIDDVGAAADLLRHVYDESRGNDGFVSIEVSPLLAANTQGSVTEGVRLHGALKRPNVMIKIPGTPEGLPAVQELLERGINVNITLLFSVENYVKVARTYCTALKNRKAKGEDISKVRSVASFFVSRVDTTLDKQLNAIIAKGGAQADEARSLLGKFGVANSKLAYKEYQKIFAGAEFAELKSAGAAPQRPLWASTSVKNPAYRDVMYCEELIGPDTVNTMPHETVLAFADHGTVAETLTKNVAEAEKCESRLRALGIDVAAALHELQVDGVKKFSESFVALNNSIQKKLGR